MKAVTFGYKGFRRYIESLPSGAVAGITHTACDCPLARYGQAQGASDVYIGDEDIGVDKRYRSHSRWTRRFVRLIDLTKTVEIEKGFGYLCKPVTREEVLAVLDKVIAA